MGFATPTLHKGRTYPRLCIAVIAVAALCGAVPTSAQIISTSIPKAETSGTQSGEKTFAFHVMATPVSKWHYNEIVGSPWTNNPQNYDFGLFSGTPNSDFLLAGEVVVKAGKSFTIGGGGWFNKVGKVQYDFKVQTFNAQENQVIDHLTGTLDGDLNLSEGHANFFYKDVGVQAGIVHTKSTLLNSLIQSSVNPFNINQPLGSIETNGPVRSANDWDLYGVYKYAGRTSGKSGRPFGVSGGAGIYYKFGSPQASQGTVQNETLFSSFLTGTLDVWRGLGVDVSYWYIAKTKADLGVGAPVSSEKATNRLTFGFSYSFSR